VSGNVNCKPPHAAEAIAGRVRDIGNAGFEDGTKAEWFFDESRSSVREQWTTVRKAARPQVRDPEFLAKNAASGGASVSQERQRLADFENELDQVFTQLPKYALAALTAGGDMYVLTRHLYQCFSKTLKNGRQRSGGVRFACMAPFWLLDSCSTL
jgi:hypothetical protein